MKDESRQSKGRRISSLLTTCLVSRAWGFSTTGNNGGRQYYDIAIVSSTKSRRWTPSHQQLSSSTTALAISPDQVEEIFREIIDETVTLSTSVTPADEAAILTDLAEVSSDVVILSSAPVTIFLRLTVVIEKILELLSDYIPDHVIRGDELLFNIPFMVSSLFLLFRSAEPILKAQGVELDELDLTAFDLCFQPVGMTLLQFKSMKATGCFEWIDYEPGKVLIDENEYCCTTSGWKYLYWQYSGDIISSFRGKVYSSIERENGMHINYPGAQGLLGDTRFLYLLEEESREKQTQKGRSGMMDDDAIRSDTIATVAIGNTGAKLLRIDSHKLFDLMEHDERLESSIRLLLLKSLKLKIGNLLFALQDDNADAQHAHNGNGSDSCDK